MSHRALQIIDAIAALHSADVQAVYKNRALSLDEDLQEIPAASVNMGEDRPLDDDGASNCRFIDSLLAVEIVFIVRGDSEEDVTQKLMELRAASHVALMADRTLGLSTFVIDTRYQGAGTREIALINDRITGRLQTAWAVHYRMNIGNPT